ncbi:unnamed protein product [Porites evermanni]|uniref:Uncharacterized protein n=1 Tax=Porites evermanni TaxID=104178 RepID=A0ABN8LJS6_9CNID|nr:unnamed protein product [Porites evermanni]
MIAALDRHLNEKGYKFSIIRDREFHSSKQVLEGKARQLRQPVWANFFGLRGRQEHHAMKMEDFQLCKNDEGIEFVQFTEGPTKTRQGGLQSKNRDFQPRMFSVGGERCPVAIFKQFVERRPLNMRWSGPFYLSIKRNRTLNDNI